MPTHRSASAQQAPQPSPAIDVTDVMRQLDRLEQILAQAESWRSAASVEPQQAARPVRAWDLAARQEFAAFIDGLAVPDAYFNDTAAVIGNRPDDAPAAGVVNRPVDTTAAVVNRPVEDAFRARGARN